jgi:indole-3-glycerol phosphate synthase
MATILDKIKAYKLDEIAAAKAALPLSAVEADARDAPRVRPFADALRAAEAKGYGLIAEIKKASPSKGLIRADFDPPALAQRLRGRRGDLPVGADRHALLPGRAAYLRARGRAVGLPVLRKDFLYDPTRWPRRGPGGRCILIIMASSRTRWPPSWRTPRATGGWTR